MRRLRVGDIVREHGGRHEGEVVMLFGYGTYATKVRVRWLDNRKWTSDFDHDELVLVRGASGVSPAGGSLAARDGRPVAAAVAGGVDGRPSSGGFRCAILMEIV